MQERNTYMYEKQPPTILPFGRVPHGLSQERQEELSRRFARSDAVSTVVQDPNAVQVQTEKPKDADLYGGV